MSYRKTEPLKITIYGDAERITDNSIKDALRTIEALLTEGTLSIHILNVSEQIRRTEQIQAIDTIDDAKPFTIDELKKAEQINDPAPGTRRYISKEEMNKHKIAFMNATTDISKKNNC